ncbi:MAG TPA: heme-binding protein [Steroidobacteraceae bacterium]|nr:heme-binding protein [Steroidobacteraceae bacterium]
MRMKPRLTTADVRQIAAACRDAAQRHKFCVTIAIVDDAAQLLYLERLDARPLTVDVALGKARTAVMTHRPSGVWQARVQEAPNLMALDLLPLRGALPLLYQGECVGAIGVSGVTSEEDELVAQAGVDALAALSIDI